MRSYKVVIERDESGAWIARVPRVPGCHTYGRTLGEARRRIREALGLWVADADRAHLDFDVRLPEQARRVVRPLTVARRRAGDAQAEARAALVVAARTLVRAGFSLRDAGEVLALSHQRVAQVLASPRRAAATASARRPYARRRSSRRYTT